MTVVSFSNVIGQKATIELKFTGLFDTTYAQLDSVKIENLTQGGDTVLYYPDTTLVYTYIGIGDQNGIENSFRLFQNYPNPFTDLTYIQIYIPERDFVEIIVSDLSGRKNNYINRTFDAGYHTFIFTSGKEYISIITAKWHGVSKSIKVINHGTNHSIGSNINYSGKINGNFHLKSQYSLKGISFNIGDSLSFTGYYNTLVNNILDLLGVSTTYTFQFYQPCSSSFEDARDSTVYQAVQIGSQCWMAENLAYLPTVSPASLGSDTSSYYYVYGYNGTNVIAAKATPNYQTYGVLYNWPAAMNGDTSSNSVPGGIQGICPTGWHFPGDAEWDIIVNYLGGSLVAGGKMKETGTTHWNSPNTGANNISGFSALPGGYRSTNGNAGNIGYDANFWSSTEDSSNYAWFRYLYYYSEDVLPYSYHKGFGFSVRCIKD